MSRVGKALRGSIRSSGLFRSIPVLKRPGGLLLALLVCLLLAPGAVSAAEPDGKTLYTRKGCPACHGEDGRTPRDATTPIIAGQMPRYLQIVMRAYKTGERSGGLANLHVEVSDLLSDDEMRIVAEYVATLK